MNFDSELTIHKEYDLGLALEDWFKAMANRKVNGTFTLIVGFLALFALVNVFSATNQLNLNGYGYVSEFRLFNMQLGSLDVEVYLWTSVVLTFLFFGATIYSVYRGVPTDPIVLEKLGKLENDLAVHQNMLENTQIGFFKKLEDNEKASEEYRRKTSLNLEETRKETLANLAEHKKALDNIEKDNTRSASIIKKQTEELTDVKEKVEGIERTVNGTIKEEAELSSKTKLNKFKSVTPDLATKFSEAGIRDVSELLVADSVSIAEKVSEPAENVANLQAVAQLLMVPGIDEKQAKLLVRFGVTSRRELANQDPVHLYRGIVGIARTSVDEGKLPASKIPTIEDVSTWIRQARL